MDKACTEESVSQMMAKLILDWMNGVPMLMAPGLGGEADPSVNAVSSGLYGLLGAELCRVTGNQVFCEMAYSAMQWIDRFLVNPEDGLIWDHINGTSCEVTNWTFTCRRSLGPADGRQCWAIYRSLRGTRKHYEQRYGFGNGSTNGDRFHEHPDLEHSPRCHL